MKKLLICFLLGFCFLQSAAAESTNVKLDITVNGLVCDFCARAVEKVFDAEYDLKEIDIDLSAKLITIVLPPETKISDEKIESLIADAGYAFVSVRRYETSD